MAEPFVRADVREFLDMIADAPAGPKMSEAGPVEARAMMRQMGREFELPAGELAIVRDIATPGGIGLRLYDDRPSRDASPVLLFLHGGGFVIGGIDDYDSACGEMARVLGLPVVSVDYRLAPEHPWPAGPDDCEAAARWIASGPPELGFAVTGLIIAGDSAGGGLTIVTSMALRDAPAAVPVLVQMPLYPVTDLANSHRSHRDFGEGFLLEKSELRWFWHCYAADPSHWRASPLLADPGGMPPTLLVTCSLDPLRDEGRAYAAAAIVAGVPTIFREARGMIHGFLTFRKALPSAGDDLRVTLAALQALLATESQQGTIA
jgi:acetyl esterase